MGIPFRIRPDTSLAKHSSNNKCLNDCPTSILSNEGSFERQSNSPAQTRFQDHDSVIAVHSSEANIMFLVIGIVLFLLWIGGFFIFHVTSFFIHILLILAVIVIVFHFLRGSA